MDELSGAYFTFDNFAVRIRLTGLDDFVARGEKFETMRLTPFRNFSDSYVLKGYYSSRLFVRREFKVVQAIVIQNEPAALPAFYPENSNDKVKDMFVP